MNRRNVYILALFLIAVFISCSKYSELVPEHFYGKWKTSYGDTIVFSQKNGINIATYNYSMNTLMPTRGDHEFAYRDGKLGVKQWQGAPDFNFFSSFRWIQPGESFEILGGEWFSFLSSGGAYFTFTKMP